VVVDVAARILNQACVPPPLGARNPIAINIRVQQGFTLPTLRQVAPYNAPMSCLPNVRSGSQADTPCDPRSCSLCPKRRTWAGCGRTPAGPRRLRAVRAKSPDVEFRDFPHAGNDPAITAGLFVDRAPCRGQALVRRPVAGG